MVYIFRLASLFFVLDVEVQSSYIEDKKEERKAKQSEFREGESKSIRVPCELADLLKKIGDLAKEQSDRIEEMKNDCLAVIEKWEAEREEIES